MATNKIRFVLSEKTEKYPEHLEKFSNPEYYSNLYAHGNGESLWGIIRNNLSGHPASIKLFLDNFVKFYPADENIKRDEIKRRFFMHNYKTHFKIADSIPNRSKILDIGAGIGCLKDILDRENKKVDYYAHDISEEFLKLNNADESKKYCCDFSDLHKLIRGITFDYIVDCNATHGDYSDALKKVSGKNYLFKDSLVQSNNI